MIQANELRIGNWVENFPPFGKYKPQYFKVSGLFIRQVENCKPGDANHKGIPLTPEILQNAGFKLWGYRAYKERGKDYDFCISREPDAYYFGYPSFDADAQSPDPSPTGQPIKYVHQLQNLYFSLYGEELPITLP